MEIKWLAKMKKARELKKYDIDATLRRIQEERAYYDPGSEEFKRLQLAYEQELKNKKLVKEMQYLGFPKDKILLIVGMFILYGFTMALDLDCPAAIKHAQFIRGFVKKA